MAIFTNQTKSNSALTNGAFGNITQWSSSMITWADPVIGWASLKGDGYVNQTKNTSVISNQVKN